MSRYVVEIDYEGKTNDGFTMHLKMRKAFRDEPERPKLFEERLNGHMQAVMVDGWEKIERKSETIFRVKAVPDKEIRSYVDRIASAFAENGWQVSSAAVL